jgi:hypothetical protein
MQTAGKGMGSNSKRIIKSTMRRKMRMTLASRRRPTMSTIAVGTMPMDNIPMGTIPTTMATPLLLQLIIMDTARSRRISLPTKTTTMATLPPQTVLSMGMSTGTIPTVSIPMVILHLPMDTRPNLDIPRCQRLTSKATATTSKSSLRLGDDGIWTTMMMVTKMKTMMT